MMNGLENVSANWYCWAEDPNRVYSTSRHTVTNIVDGDEQILSKDEGHPPLVLLEEDSSGLNSCFYNNVNAGNFSSSDGNGESQQNL